MGVGIVAKCIFRLAVPYNQMKGNMDRCLVCYGLRWKTCGALELFLIHLG